MGLRINLAFLIVGYSLAYINIPVPWLITLITLIYFSFSSSPFSFLTFNDNNDYYDHHHHHNLGYPKTSSSTLTTTSRRNNTNTTILSSPSSSDHHHHFIRKNQQFQQFPQQQYNNNGNNISLNGVLCINNVMETVWSGWISHGIQNRINQWLSENRPLRGLMESLIVSKLDMDTERPPVISTIQCIEHSRRTTVMEAHFQYGGNMMLEWMMRPSVLPFDLRCLVHDMSVSGRVRIQIHYKENQLLDENDENDRYGNEESEEYETDDESDEEETSSSGGNNATTSSSSSGDDDSESNSEKNDKTAKNTKNDDKRRQRRHRNRKTKKRRKKSNVQNKSGDGEDSHIPNEFKYLLNRYRISKVDISLSEYPDIDGEVQMFDSFDLKSLSQAIPALTHTMKRKFRENVMMFVFPNTIPLYASGVDGDDDDGDDDDSMQHVDSHKRGAKTTSTKLANSRKAQMGFDKTDMEDLEDELKKSLLDINQLLKMSRGANTGDKSPEAVKIEVCESVLRFLKAGQQPGRIPVSLMDTVKRGFGILSVLVFGEKPVDGGALVTGNILDLLNGTAKKEVDEQILDIILRPENMTFIGDVCRMCSLADDLVRNIFKVEDRQVQARVNRVLKELSLQDMPFIVMNRQRSSDE